MTLRLTLPAGSVLILPSEAASVLEATLREHRRASKPVRDLGAAAEQFLLRNGEAATPSEIARGISARDSAVRAILKNDPRFSRAPRLPHRSPKAKLWTVAPSESGLGLESGTSTRNEGP